ncbi:glycosyltransferase [Leucothrix arctica]|uniref:Mannosyl transferase n=1 Tax=Leucothrix arctica TaxID=1481894 RepID=A0A317CJQ2_9GAMM|nr:glycosyltransferase [Leucothrix arctica]PWQ98716.1 mannosyl transferase [Leucothrix arctica]
MKIVLFTHPDFLGHQSMPRFSQMILKGMQAKGHDVSVWTPKPFFFRLYGKNIIGKWLGYIDQYIVFPMLVRRKLSSQSRETLFVFCDQALGPWVKLVKRRPHVIHCHDFLAQKSALGFIPENVTKLSGRIYQKYIYNGYSEGRNFISVSTSTQSDLHFFLKEKPEISQVVYNGLNRIFVNSGIELSRKYLSGKYNLKLESGYVLHVGGNQWYKNRLGVVTIYDSWRKEYIEKSLPLILVGEKPSKEILLEAESSDFKKDIIFLSGVEDDDLDKFYSGSSCFLFPSLAEGFGWPIAEAMALEAVVITTNEAPMTEVGGNAAFYIDLMPRNNPEELDFWKKHSAGILEKVTTLNEKEKSKIIKKGIDNIERFSQSRVIDGFESIYKKVLLKDSNYD